ncbi:MAG: hypothetical protein ACE5HL_13225, partial [Terriglobia bacterium]
FSSRVPNRGSIPVVILTLRLIYKNEGVFLLLCLPSQPTPPLQASQYDWVTGVPIDWGNQ